jgi:hypothetical protein
LTEAEEKNYTDRKGNWISETVITVNRDTFLPGSIVLYRTWMNGSGMNLIAQPPISPSASPLPPVLGTRQPQQDKNLMSDLRKIVLDKPKSRLLEDNEGDLERIWRLMGVDDKNKGIELMLQMGRDTLESNQLIFNTDSDVFPPDLLSAVSNMTMEDVNVVLYRCGPEELDSISMLFLYFFM